MPTSPSLLLSKKIMAKLEFKVSADKTPVDELYNSVNRIQQLMKGFKLSDMGFEEWIKQLAQYPQKLKACADEIEKVKAKIASFDNLNDKKGLERLSKQLGTAKDKYHSLVQETVNTFNEIQSSTNKASAALLSSQKDVDSITWKLIDQKKVVADLQSEIRRLNEAYRAANKEEKESIFTQITSKKQQLEDERISLNSLRAEQERARLTVKGLKDEISGYDRAISGLTNAQENNEISLKKMLAAFGGMAAIKSFISDMVQVRGEFQKTQMAFETMLGSKEKADMLMSQMVQTAAKTPFDLQGVADGAKQLLAYGTEAKEVNETLIRLGNIASGLNIPLGEMVYLYGTTQTQGRLFTQDVRQFMGRGIPLVKELASLLGKTEEEINKMVTAGQIGFPQVQQVIEKMTNEGGQFYNLMEKQSQTLSGQISNLGDAWDQMLNSIGEGTQGLASATISMATGVVENYEKVGKILVSLIGLYGLHKTALIANAVATNGLTVAENLLYAKSEALLKIRSLLNATLLSNPYVLLAAIVASFAATMWILHDSTTAAEKAQKQLNKEQEEAAQRKQELTSKTDSLISKINSETESVYSQFKAYKELMKLFPELGNMTFEEFKKLPQDQQKKIFSNINENREMNDAVKAYEADLKKIENIKKKIQETETSPYNKSDNLWIHDVEQLNKQLDTANNLAKLHKEEIEKIKQLQWEANTSVEEKVKHYEDVKKRLVEEKDELEKTLTKSEDIAAAWMGVPDIINNIKLDALNKQIEETTGKINSLTGKETPIVKNKSYWEKKKKDAEAARDALDVSKKNSEDWNKYTREIQQAQKEIAKYDTTDKADNEAKKHLKLQSELSRSLLESELKLQSSRLAIMQDGKDKRVLLADQEYKETLATIQKERDEYLKKVKEAKATPDPAILSTFDNRETVAKDKRNTDVANINKEYVKEFSDRQKEISSVFLSEEAKRLSAVKDRYDKERKWAQEQHKTGGLNDDEYESYLGTIGEAETEETLKSLLDKYQDYDAKRRELERNYTDEVSTLSARRTEENKAEVDAALQEALKRHKEELANLDFSEFQESDLWKKMFGDLDKMALPTLQNILNKAKEVNTKGFTPEQLKEYQAAIDRLEEAVRNRNPFKAIHNDWKNLMKAIREGNKDGIANAFAGIDTAVQSINADLNTLAGGIGDIFGDEAGYAAGQVAELTSAIGGFASAASKIAGGDILGGITSVVSSIGSIFSMGKKVKEMNRQAREEQQKFYDEARAGELEYQALLRERLRLAQQIGETSLQYFDRLQKELHKQSGSITEEYDEVWAKLMGEQYIEKVNYRHGTWFRKAKTWNDYGSLAGKTYEEIESLYTQNKLTDSAKVLFEQLRKLKEEGADVVDMMDDLNQSMSEAWTGTTEDAIAQSILDGISAGKAGVDDLTGYFRDMMKNAMLQGVNMKYLQTPIKKFYEQFAQMSESGGMLTEEEIKQLQEMYTRMFENAEAQFENLKKISGLDFSTTEEETSDNSLKGTFAKASQESIDLLAGQTGAQRVAIESIREQMQFIRDLQTQGWRDVAAIKDLVGKLKDISDRIDRTTDEIKKSTADISDHSKRTVEALESTLNVKVKM